MTKFNRKFNSACSRLAFWHNITTTLAGFDNLLKSASNLTPDDMRTLKAIHRKLFECYSDANDRLQAHGQRINTLRKEIHYGS